MKTRVRYGILGFGYFAERAIMPALRSSPNSELVAIQKRSLQKAREKAAEHGIRMAFDSAEQLVAHPQVDAVFIVSANNAHHGETITAARAGKHVLVEKPMALNSSEAEEMTEECRKHDVNLMVGHMLRFSPLLTRIQDLVRSGEIGRIILAKSEFIYDAGGSRRQWLTDSQIAGGGPIFDIGVHCLDTLRFVLEDEVISTKSQMEPVFCEKTTEMTGVLGLKFEKGTVGLISCSFFAPFRRTSLEIIGTEGLLQCENFTRGDRVTDLTIMPGSGKNKETRVESIQVPNLYVEEINHFSDSILRKGPSPIPGNVGIANQKVLDAAIQAG